MGETVEYLVADGVAFLGISNPPVNALSRAVRVALMEALDRAEECEDVHEIVLYGKGVTFPARADLAEYESGLRDPTLRDLCTRVEYCEKPVIAALHGTVYAGGCELALAAHYRVAHGATRISLPEIRVGLPPGGGGSQRLPRLIGAGPALDMLLTGAVSPVSRPPGSDLVDDVSDGAARLAAARLAQTLRSEQRGPRRLSEETAGFADPQAYQREVALRREQLPPDPESAPAQIVSLVEAAQLVPFDTGQEMEQAAFDTCLASDNSHALRHAFRAERDARRFAVAARVELPRLQRIAVLGGGPLALQITLAALNAGLGVNWGTRDPERLKEGMDQLTAMLRRGVSEGGISPQAIEKRLDLLRGGDSAEMLEGADLAIRAARGQGDLPIPRGLVQAVAIPGKVEGLGLRFTPPAFATRLLEIIHGPRATQGQRAAAVALSDRLSKVPVIVKSEGESAAGRLEAALQRAADGLVDMGLNPYDVDRIVRDWGWARPPFVMRDMIGLQDLARVPRAAGAVNWSALLAEAGRTGRAAGRGVYNWDKGDPHPDITVRTLVETQRPAQKIAPERAALLLVGAMANEGARMLEQGMLRRAADVDVVAMLALDFPRWKGGPMKAVSQQGLFRVWKFLTTTGHPDTAFWTPVPVWQDLIKNGRNFDALTGARRAAGVPGVSR